MSENYDQPLVLPFLFDKNRDVTPADYLSLEISNNGKALGEVALCQLQTIQPQDEVLDAWYNIYSNAKTSKKLVDTGTVTATSPRATDSPKSARSLSVSSNSTTVGMRLSYLLSFFAVKVNHDR